MVDIQDCGGGVHDRLRRAQTSRIVVVDCGGGLTLTSRIVVEVVQGLCWWWFPPDIKDCGVCGARIVVDVVHGWWWMWCKDRVYVVYVVQGSRVCGARMVVEVVHPLWTPCGPPVDSLWTPYGSLWTPYGPPS